MMRRSVLRFRKACILAVWLAFAAATRAEDAPAKPRWEVIAECQMVVLPQKAALSLIPDLGDDAKIDAAFGNLDQMIGRGEATLVGNLLVRGMVMEKLTAGSLEEVGYPVEWDRPQLPYPVPKEKAVEVLKAWPVVAITPSRIHKRNVGPSVALTTSVSDDGRWIICAGEVQHDRVLRIQKYDAGILPSGERIGIELPIFSTLRNVVALRVRSGQRLLVGVHKLPKEDTMELFFLRVRTQQPAGAP